MCDAHHVTFSWSRNFVCTDSIYFILIFRFEILIKLLVYISQHVIFNRLVFRSISKGVHKFTTAVANLLQ